MRLLVTGCPKSGTQYMAELLCRLGLEATHEKVFALHRPEDWGTKDVSVSWEAAANLEKAMMDGVTALWHQVRDPLKVIRCMVSHKFLSDDGYGDASDFMKKHVPEAWAGKSLLDRTIRFWIGWNKLVEAGQALSRCISGTSWRI